MENETVYVVISLYEDQWQYADETTCGVFRDKAKASEMVNELYKNHLESVDPENLIEDQVHCEENFACVNLEDGSRYSCWIDRMEVQ